MIENNKRKLLLIPRGQSEDFNKYKFKKPNQSGFYTDEFLKE